ncbi:hypothetical protein ACXJJ3_22690 [Kribbella sp. WER1]
MHRETPYAICDFALECTAQGPAPPAELPTTARPDTRPLWGCVDDKVLPDWQPPAVPVESIPARVVRAVVVDAHIPEADVRLMTKARAVQRLAEFYTSGE